jgi:hypothetical protein
VQIEDFWAYSKGFPTLVNLIASSGYDSSNVISAANQRNGYLLFIRTVDI